jgi:hypothetical protein
VPIGRPAPVHQPDRLSAMTTDLRGGSASFFPNNFSRQHSAEMAKKSWSEQMNVKAPERSCRHCGETIPAQPRGPGRPREFCTRRCRRDFYHQQEQATLNRERAEEWERRRYELDVAYYGKRKAKRLAKERAESRRRNGG